MKKTNKPTEEELLAKAQDRANILKKASRSKMFLILEENNQAVAILRSSGASYKQISDFIKEELRVWVSPAQTRAWFEKNKKDG